MKLGISKKLIGAHGVGLVLFLIIAIFGYRSLNSYSSIQKRTDELVFTNVKMDRGKSDEELSFEKEVEKGFIELQEIVKFLVEIS